MHLWKTLPALLLVACASSTPAPVTDADDRAKEVAAEHSPLVEAAGAGSQALGSLTGGVDYSAERQVPPYVSAAVDAADRSAADRALDEGREPAKMLAYFGVAPGMRVGELFAGGGYTAELLGRVVGPDGDVYGVNSPWALERFAEQPWSERLSKPVNENITRFDREFSDPFPAELVDLDRVFSVLVYHDFIWMGTDMAAHNKAIFDALKPGGVYCLVDHNAADGAGTSQAESLHRIEQSEARAQIEAAGFVYAGEADFLRNADDTRDWSASPRAAGERRGKSDRFVMAFIKP